MKERLQKYIARSGVCSRRAAEQLILDGRIKVNGQTITQLGAKAADTDIVQLDGQVLAAGQEYEYIMLHNPEGYITTSHDQFNRPTVLDLVESEARLYPVGRLDYDTSGLLILTNDGELTQLLTHPKHKVEKIYIARIRGIPSASSLERFKSGIEIDGCLTAKADITVQKKLENSCSVKIIVAEGRNRQVRKMCEAIGHTVMSLKRVGIGKLYLGELPRGQWRRLTKAEVRYLLNIPHS
jgi:23S rRNA pseudouridine2605 synthase